MINIVINEVQIENFMSISNRKIEFGLSYNELIGFNGVGKTTVLSAITWCLFGKDFYDRMAFDIFPIKEGIKQENVVPTVKVTMSFNNQEYTIERTIQYSPKGTVQTIFVNGMKFKRTEYDKFLVDRLSLNAEEFKVLSNIDYAVSLPQTELKNLIMNLVGEITDGDMFQNGKVNERFESIKDKLLSIGTDELKKSLSDSKRSKEQETLRTIGAIEQEEHNIAKFTFNDDEVNSLLKRREELYQINANYSEKLKEENRKKIAISNMDKEIENMKREIGLLENKFRLKNKEGLQKKNEIAFATDAENLKKTSTRRIDRKIIDAQYMLEDVEKKMKRADTEKETALEHFQTLKGQEIVLTSTKCEMCGQELPQERLDEMLAKKQKLHDDQLHSWVAVIKNKNEEIKGYEEQIQKFNSEILRLQAERAEIENTDYSFIANESEETKKMYDELTKLREECLAIKNELNDKKYKIKLKEQELVMLPQPMVVPSIENTELEMKNIETKLANYRSLKTHESNYQELILKKESLDNEIAEIVYKQDLLKEYVSLKSEIMSKRFQKSFKYISFKTYELNLDGSRKECFKIVMDGKTYATLSGGERMRASIDLVCGIQNLKQKKMPLLIDRMGELDEFPDWVDTQVVCCRAIAKPQEDEPNYYERMMTFSELQMRKRD